ncbi:DUF3618 domain-containing protein [Intrasporangium calvum]|uniref:DUF3618 domain-containing protein n=1 Tax=Intrasporangium calvum TaxID=53358 RepID=A0ABT5GHH0_9MICO|nr:DUF3618 domain-containing protein [Intrasporangium calvum]MDC5697335.1 DUF3618 domain-containing protein [Intrasporangium calvum]
MSDHETERLRTEVERTRQDLSDNVNRLGTTVSPSTIAERQKARMGQKVSSWRDRIMGAAESAKESTMGTAHGMSDSGHSAVESVQGTAHDMKYKARQQAQGNPLAAGVVALAAGWLVGSVLPASEKEKQAAAAVKEQAQPLVEQATAEVKAAGSEMAEHLKQPAQEAVEEVRSAASDSAAEVKAQTQTAADSVRTEAEQQARDVRS